MKYGLSLLLVGIVSALGIATLLLGIDLVHPFRPANVVVHPDPPPEAIENAKAKTVSKPARSRVPRTGSTADPIAAGGRISSATNNETTDKTSYGDAALSIRRLDRGHDMETLVYTRNRGKEITVVSLEDGKVTSPSPSGSALTVKSPGLRTDERATALLARPTEPQPASMATPSSAEVQRTIPRAVDKTLAEVPAAANPPGAPTVKGNVGTCGEYRDGKLTVKPCSQVTQSTSDWLAKGSDAATESAPAGNLH